MILAMVLGGMLVIRQANAQFSPGDLSRAHMQLEGTGNCAQCHEVGKEISGSKCMSCHTEIRNEIDSKHGYHFTTSMKQCVACHKEHLGRDVQTILFDKDTLDHRMTGFALTGKHIKTQCEQCHSTKNIKNLQIMSMVLKSNRKTFMGLSAGCVSCHEDRHRGTVGVECQSCHTTNAWSPASNFNHSKTKFALTGKHSTVQCAKCHSEISPTTTERPIILSTKSFADCKPCHESPHKEKFSGQECRSCHSADGWSVLISQKFDHNLTGFKLVGRHATVKCQQCHKNQPGVPFAKAFRIPHEKCTDCHSDYHAGEFLKTYNNDCSKCHTPDSFSPSTFTLEEHSHKRFVVTGAHTATPCISCHTKAEERRVFHFASIKCESCHKDRHGGQFTKLMTDQSCAKCHSTVTWTSMSFDHSTTSFQLVGKHSTAKCEGCHKPGRVNGGTMVQYRGVKTGCESCHPDAHAAQFASNSITSCSNCHSPDGWQLLRFNHDTQSTFALSGAHKKTECRSCHHEELIAGRRTMRFKPLSNKCESCHKSGSIGNG